MTQKKCSSCSTSISRNNKSGFCKSCSKLAKSPYSKECREKAICMYNEGHSAKEIKQALNIPVHILFKNLKKINYTPHAFKEIAINQIDFNIFSINSRDFYLSISYKKDFTSWVKLRIKQFKLIENSDYKIQIIKAQNKSIKKNYYFTNEAFDKIKKYDENLLRPTDSNILYFIHAKKTNLIKIGITNNIAQRLNAIQLMSPDDLELISSYHHDNVKIIEKHLHNKFKKYLHHGEWFYFDTEIKNFINNYNDYRG